MVTVIKVKASVGNFFGDGGVNTNKRHRKAEDAGAGANTDYPTMKRYHHSESRELFTIVYMLL